MTLSQLLQTMNAKLGQAIVPSSYLAGQGIGADQAPGVQDYARRQFGMGLLSSVGTGAPVGARLGQAFGYAGAGADRAVQGISHGQDFERQQSRLERQDAAQVGQWGAENAQRAATWEQQRDQFKQSLDLNKAQLEQASAHATAMEGIARTSGSAQAASAFSEARIRQQQLEQTVKRDQAIQSIIDEPGPLTDEKIKRIQVQSLKFSGGAFAPPTLAEQLAQAFGGAGLGAQPNPPGSMPTPAQILQAGQRPPGP